MAPRIRNVLPWLALAVICLAGLWLRLKNNGYGLPYVYNVDEGSHFTSRAVAMFGGNLDPGYFQNPSAFTYLDYFALQLFGADDVPGRFGIDPAGIYDLARSLAAVLCVGGVIGVFYAARRLWDGWTAVAASGLLCFAFLSVAYGRVAVTDVGTLLPVSIALLGAVRVYETGARRWYLIAGAAAGLAVGFKYTAGLSLLPLLLACGFRVGRGERRELLALAGALIAAVLAFFITTPYFFLSFDDAERQIRGQAATAGDFGKLGQRGDSGLAYYLRSLTWGLGIGGMVAAAAGALFEFRRDVVRGLLLVIFPLALFVYLATQSRYFGRWLLPAYPALALLAGTGVAQAARLLRMRPWLQAAAFGVLLATVLVQPLTADIRTTRLLGREDTRNEARAWLAKREPRATRAVIEPAVPGRWYRLTTRRGTPIPGAKQFVRGFIKENRESRLDYGTTINPRTIDEYRQLGFCLVVTMSVIRGRSEKDGLRPALAYYRRLEKESRLLAIFSPYRKGAKAPEFDFDLSYNYYPSAFARPGPEVRIYRLNRCKQKYGPLGR